MENEATCISKASNFKHGGLRLRDESKDNLVKFPLISIITVVYNGEQYLEQTINSIIKQTYKNIEYIIIDGGSIDSTLNIIEKYSPFIDYWLSEPDKGIADAMNKGVALASGQFIVFIHADDYLYDNKVIEKIVKKMDIKNDIILLSVLFGKKKLLVKPRKLNWWTNLKIPACHQGILCKRSLFDRLGLFDKQFQINMDYDFLLRAYHLGVEYQIINVVFAFMRDTGVSSRRDAEGLFNRLKEEQKVHQKNSSTILRNIGYTVYWFFYWYYKKIMFYIL